MSIGNPFPLVRAMLVRNAFSSVLFVCIIALAVALGIPISAQERALRQGSSRAADRFDLLVAAPGSQTDLLFSVVYLNPSAVELMTPEVTATVLAEKRASFAAPIGFGDSIEGDPVVGTTADFVQHLSQGLADGRAFTAVDEAVIGALSPHQLGETLEVSHGQSGHDDENADNYEAHDDHAEHDHEGHHDLLVVGRMQPTGTPWDRAIVTPIEYNWQAHGLDTGHAPGDTRIGPPFDAAHLPGVPAIVLNPESVAASYGLRSLYRSQTSTAFFPAEVLVDLYAVMGDISRIMAGLTLAAQVLVVVAILAGLFALLDLQRQRFAVLRALGAPRRFIFSVVWTYIVALIASGAGLGLAGGYLIAAIVSAIISGQTGVAMQASIGSGELLLVGALVVCGAVLASLPALLIYNRPVVDGLRA